MDHEASSMWLPRNYIGITICFDFLKHFVEFGWETRIVGSVRRDDNRIIEMIMVIMLGYDVLPCWRPDLRCLLPWLRCVFFTAVANSVLLQGRHGYQAHEMVPLMGQRPFTALSTLCGVCTWFPMATDCWKTLWPRLPAACPTSNRMQFSPPSAKNPRHVDTLRRP